MTHCDTLRGVSKKIAVKPCKDCGCVHRKAGARQQRFAQEYLIDLNATAAAKRAGYSQRNASSLGYQLLQKAPVQCLVRQGAKSRAERTAITADEVLSSLHQIAMADLAMLYDSDGSLLPIDEMPEELRRVIAGLETEEIFSGQGEARRAIGHSRKLRMPDRIRALELLGKHLRLWADVVELKDEAELRKLMSEGRRRARRGAA